jgi:hypothetical protein
LQCRALSILDDLERTFASSPFVELEVLPKAQFGRAPGRGEFYRTFFAAVTSLSTNVRRPTGDPSGGVPGATSIAEACVDLIP